MLLALVLVAAYVPCRTGK